MVRLSGLVGSLGRVTQACCQAGKKKIICQRDFSAQAWCLVYLALLVTLSTSVSETPTTEAQHGS